ncbi:MAG TPA: hypothetical protein VKN76_01355, partial [Kiloniellaceae bacterium]|nr:hypothetical protein [Kiloniellaceae bacterium]
DALQSFQARTESINRRLLASTAPNDPSLQADWGRSRGDLDVVEEVVGQYETLSAENLAAALALDDLQREIRAQADTATAAAATAAQAPRRAALADDTERTLAVVEKLSAALAQDGSALKAQVGLAKLDLAAMEAAIPGGAYVGDALARRAQGVVAGGAITGGAITGGAITGRESTGASADGAAKLVGRRDPLAVINFADDDSVFEPALFSIVYAALSRRPTAAFDLVGVSPSQAKDADDGDSGPVYTSRLDLGRANAQRVRRALLSMGLPATRMTLDIASSPIAKNEEVHIYVR